MIYPRITISLLALALLLFGASCWLIAFAPARSGNSQEAPCSHAYQSGDVWVRWMDDGDRAEFTPLVHLGKETHRLERHPTGDRGVSSRRDSVLAHAVADGTTLTPCYCGRAEQLWKRAAMPALDALRPGGRWVLVMNECFPLPAPIELSLDPENEEPRVISLPSVGALQVELEPNPSLSATAAHAEITIRAIDAGPHHPADDVMRFALASGATRRLPDILVGHRFEIEARALRGELVERFVVAGPVPANEVRRVAIDFGEHHPLLEMRCVDETQAAIASGLISALWLGDDGYVIYKQILTTKDGRARFMLELPASAAHRGELFVQARDQRCVLRAELPPVGSHALGTLVLGSVAPEIVGTIVNEHRFPVPDAEISICEVEAEFQGDQLEIKEIAPRAIFRSDERGHFLWDETRRLPDAMFLLISARLDEKVSAQRLVAVGSAQLEVQLGVGGTLDGRLELAGSPVEATNLYVLPQVEGRTVNAYSASAISDARGNFRFSHLNPGTYTLAVGPPPRDADTPHVPAFELRDVQVSAGERCRDPRLVRIECSGYLQRLDFRLKPEVEPIEEVLDYVAVYLLNQPARWLTLQPSFPTRDLARLYVPLGNYAFCFGIKGEDQIREYERAPDGVIEISKRAPSLGERILEALPAERDACIAVLEFQHLEGRSKEDHAAFEKVLVAYGKRVSVGFKSVEHVADHVYVLRVTKPGIYELRWSEPENQKTRRHELKITEKGFKQLFRL